MFEDWGCVGRHPYVPAGLLRDPPWRPKAGPSLPLDHSQGAPIRPTLPTPFSLGAAAARTWGKGNLLRVGLGLGPRPGQLVADRHILRARSPKMAQGTSSRHNRMGWSRRPNKAHHTRRTAAHPLRATARPETDRTIYPMSRLKSVESISSFVSTTGVSTGLDLRCGAGLEAASPKNPHLAPRLLDLVVHDLLTHHGGDPLQALTVTGQVVRGTPWAGYRSGRSRLATMAACYLTWLVPPRPWRLVETTTISTKRITIQVAGEPPRYRAGFTWKGPDGQRLIDLLLVDDMDRRVAWEAATDWRDGSQALRLLNLSAPRQSVLHTGPNAHIPLSESEWMFER
jgi:hypothetical protein